MKTKTTRKRDAAATREDILEAAKRQFALKGFDAAGVRDIAAEAGVNPALVNRYFGSKEGLFEEAIIPGLNIDYLLDWDKEAFGERIAALIVADEHEEKDADTALAFAHSIGSETVGPMMRNAIETNMIVRLARWLGGRDSNQRATLIIAQLLGFDLLYRMAAATPRDRRYRKRLAKHLARTLQDYVDEG